MWNEQGTDMEGMSGQSPLLSRPQYPPYLNGSRVELVYP